MNIEILVPTILYAMSYVLLLCYLAKTRANYVAIYIVSIWVVSSFFAIFFQATVHTLYGDSISYLPYAFMMVCFLITIMPIIKFGNIADHNKNDITPDILIKVMWFFIIISIIPFIENLRQVVLYTSATNGDAIADMYDSKMYGGGFKITWLSSVGMLFNSIDGIFLTFLFFTPFYLLTQPNLNKVFSVLMFLPVGTHLLFQIACSGRGTVVMFILVSLFFLLLFKNRIPQKRLRMVKVGGLSIIGLLVSAMLIITFARKEATNAGDETSVFLGYYIAKSHLDFNSNLWNIPVYMEGDNTLSFFKDLIGLETFSSFLKKEAFWGRRIGVPPGYFYTYIGDTFMDFGPLLTIIIFSICSVCACRFFSSNRGMPVLRLFFFYAYSEIILMGWSINYFKTFDGTRNLLISAIFLAIIIKLSKKNKWKKKRV